MTSETWIVDTFAEVGEFFNVPVTTVEYWRKQGLPGSPGLWDLSEITRWRLAKLNTSSDLKAKLTLADIRLKRAMARQKELELRKAKGELVELRDVELWAATTLIELRESVMALPEMLATSSPPELRNFVRDEADRHCRAVLTATKRRLETEPLTATE